MTSIARLCLLLWAVTLLPACSDGTSPEDEIRVYIAAAVDAAEARDAGDLADMIDAAYRDEQGHDKKRLGSMLRAYFFRHKNIHLFSKIGAIEMLADNRAQVHLHVAMAGSVIADVNALAALRAQIYAFELTLVKDDDWLLQQARWRPAGIADLE